MRAGAERRPFLFMNSSSKTRIHDCVIVGAGAAGLMTAIQAARLGVRVLLLDTKPKIGAKILMSGGTRCNVTNRIIEARDYQSGEPRVVKSVLQACRSDEVLRFFESLGVEFVEEPGGKIFPRTHSGRTVLEALVRETARLDIETAWPRRVTRLSKNGLFRICGEDFEYAARTVVLTTGGLSFPATGSDGGGYKLAQEFGHTLVETSPSLTPLKTRTELYKKLSGLSLPVRLTLRQNGRKTAAFEGSMLFTHFGLSGPVVLNISRHWIRLKPEEKGVLQVSYLPALHEDRLREMLQVARESRAWLAGWLADLLPARFVEAFMMRHGISNVPLNELERAAREKVIHEIFNEEVEVSGFLGYEKAEVTAGGIALSEVDRQTLESRKCSGLFLAGEILDVDGRIGGFNFQWAWSSGTAAARGVGHFLKNSSFASEG